MTGRQALRSIFTVLVVALVWMIGSLRASASTPAIYLLLSSTNKIQLVKRFDGDPAFLPAAPVLFNGHLWFSGADVSHGVELWRSDGTPEGTVLVEDIQPGTESSLPILLTVFNDSLIFVAYDNIHGFELRKASWNPVQGDYQVELLKDIYLGAMNGITPELSDAVLVPFRGRLCFAADDGNFGRELWCTDGTSAGTQRETDINPGAGSADPEHLTVLDTTLDDPASLFGDILVFSANDGTIGKELWRYFRSWIPPFNYSIDLISNINVTPTVGSSPAPLQNGGGFSLYDGFLYFSANDGINGRELWKTNGSGVDTVLVKDINPSGDGMESGGGVVFMNELYFAAAPAGSSDLWKTDGTSAGTLQVYNANLLYDSSTLVNFVHNNGLFFTSATELPGDEVDVVFFKWFWDPVSASWQATEIKDILAYGGLFDALRTHIAYDGKIIFTAAEFLSPSQSKPAIYRLYPDDRLVQVNRGVNVSSLAFGYTLFNDAVYFVGGDSEGKLMLLKVKK